MKVLEKRITLLTLISILLMLMLPLASAQATVNSDFQINSGGKPYLIAGVDIPYKIIDDKASSTLLFFNLTYSTDNLIWHPIDVNVHNETLQIPVEPAATSVMIHFSGNYDPFIGSNTQIEKSYGPYKVLQPGYVTDLTPVANDNGSVTLTWMDNTNMESAYVIKRDGPDGTKYFNVQNTTSEMGPVSTTDSTTSKTKSTFYAYSVAPLIDQYDIPDNIRPGVQTTFIINKAPLDGISLDSGTIQANPNIKLPVIAKPILKNPIVTTLKPIDGVIAPKYLPKDIGAITPVKPGQSSADAVLEALVAGASDWAKADLKLAITASLTTSAALGNFQQPITREHFAGIAVKLYEALSGTAAPAVSPNPFSDTTNSDVLKAYKLGIVTGVTETTFSPNTTITRQELCVMLMRAVKVAKPAIVLQTNTKINFADSDLIASWAKDAVNFAVNHGIMNGVGDNKVDPLGNTTREQAIVLIKRSYDAFK